MFNKSIDLIKGFSADICIYNLKQSCSSDCGQFITGLLKKMFLLRSISCAQFGEEGGTGSSLGPSGSWESKMP